jgi:hypothetical protein
MPLNEPFVGTEANGENNQNYCIHCYEKGKFTRPDSTLEMMINKSAEIWAEKDPNVTVEEAKTQLKNKLPTLKRWCK